MVNVDEDEASRRGGEGFHPGLGGPGQPIVVEVRTEALLAACVTVIREAFATVADDFGFTEQRVPTNPAYLALDRLRAARLRGERVLPRSAMGRVGAGRSGQIRLTAVMG